MSVSYYRKKPVVIAALQYTGSNSNEVIAFCPTARLDELELVIGTLEDGLKDQVKHVASIGDYIIQGIKGEFYPCKPDIFNMTYEPNDHI